jgi:sulfatase maturation enzyme AslB (radical SAM superfamily)
MACKYNDVVELTYKYGDIQGEKYYFKDIIQLSRCCLLKPEWFISSEELINMTDIVEYIYHLLLSDIPRESLAPGHPMCNMSACTLLPNNEIKTVMVGLSYACNLRCYNCWYDGQHHDSHKQKELYFHVLYGLKGHQLNKIILTNKGEPFFYLQETLEYIKSLSFNDTKVIEAVTNGNCLTKESINELKAISDEKGITYNLVFSIDAVTEEIYQKTRRGGNYSRVLDNLNSCVKAFSPDNVTVSYTCKRTNIKEVVQAKDFYMNNFGVNTQISFDYFEPQLEEEVRELILR